MKTDSESVLQLKSSEFEVILAALDAFQNQRRDTWPDYFAGIEGIIARISCDPGK